MGLYTSKRNVDIAAISATMQPVVNRWQNGTIRVYDPDIAGGSYNVWENETTGRAPTLLWQGPARIQPIRIPFTIPSSVDQFTTKSVRFQIPLDIEFNAGVLGRDGLRIQVVDGGMFPDLQHMQFVITTSAVSSFAWNRTFEATSEQGADVNYPEWDD